MESNPEPMWYCTSCTHQITLYQASIQCKRHTEFISSAHTSNSKLGDSFIRHTHQTPTPKTSSHNCIPITLFFSRTNKLNHKTNQLLHTLPTTSLNNINILQLNINSITKKITELTHLIYKQKNTSLHSKNTTLITNSQAHTSNFSPLRLDRPSSQKVEVF